MDVIRFLNNSDMCRVCLKRKSEFIYLISIDSLEPDEEVTIRQKLLECAPQLDLNVTQNVVICTNCLSAVNFVLDFKKQCLQTEEYVQSCVGQTGSSDVIMFDTAHRLDTAQEKVKLDCNEIEIKEEPFNEALYDYTCNLHEIKQEEENSKTSEPENEEKVTEIKSTTSILQLLLHNKREVDDKVGNRFFICKKCGKHTTSEAELISHVQVHVNQPKEEVTAHEDDGEYDSLTNSALKQDRWKHTGEIAFKCHVCEYGTARKQSLVAHLCSHTGEKPYRCTECSYETALSSCFSKHMRYHTGKLPYECKLCDYKSVEKSCIDTHMLTHTGEKPYTCTECSYACTTKSRLKIHTRTHTGEQPYGCKECDFKSANSASLKVHMRLHTGETPYKCTECSYETGSPSNLKRHMMQSHTKGIAYSCKLCGRKFLRNDTLVRHMRIHTGDKA